MQTINNNRDIVIGDVHGCLNELKILINKLDLTSNDNLYFIGDIIDRGQDTIGTIKYIFELSKNINVQLILGNHEEKFHRYLDKNKELNNDLFNSYKRLLTNDEIEFLKKSYYNYYIKKHDVMLIHGGFLKKIKLSKEVNNLYIDRKHQHFSLLTMVRYIDTKGGFIELFNNDENSSFWAEKYNGEIGTIIFGHNYFLQDSPQFFKHAIGIDTGCVYGGWLTALILSEPGAISHISVKYT